MKQPLNYAVLRYFSDIPEGNVDLVMASLAPEYGTYRIFKRSTLIEALMTAKENGILEETRTELTDEDTLLVWYRLTDYGLDLIRRFL